METRLKLGKPLLTRLAKHTQPVASVPAQRLHHPKIHDRQNIDDLAWGSDWEEEKRRWTGPPKRGGESLFSGHRVCRPGRPRGDHAILSLSQTQEHGRCRPSAGNVQRFRIDLPAKVLRNPDSPL